MKISEKEEILQAILNINSKLDRLITEDISEMKEQLADIPEMKKQLADIPEMKKQLAAIPEMKKQLEAIPEMKEDIRKLQKSVAVIEVEHGEKIQILFDVVLSNSNKIDLIDKKIDLINKRLDQHDDEIYYLKSKMQGA